MKKIASLALAALAILACQREVDTPKPERAVPTHTVTITARLAPDTKTTYDEAGKFAWVAGDQIHILAVNGDAKKQFVFTTADGGPEVQFTGEVEDGFQLTSEAAYALEFDADKKVWVLPESVNQHPAKPLANLPLFGFEDRDHLYQFITATGIVKFTVENVPIATASATLETLGEDAPSLCGELAAAPADGVVTLATLAGGQVLHTVDAPIAPNTTMSFYFFVPAGTLPAEKTQFALRDAEDAAIKSFVFQKDVEVQANRITNIAPIVLDVEIIRNRETDSLALVAIYNASKGAEWTKNKWNLSTPIDTWPAVTVTDDRVTALKLSTSGVIASEWTLPEEIGELTELTDLRINSNKLTGDLPESLYSLTKLEFLYFQNNNITGALSSKLGQLTELTQLYVDRNANMTGGIPKEIGNLKKLARINISQSGIGGEIPAELGECESLLQFMAFKTNLSGTLPDIWDMPVLQTVMLHTNPGITGELPASLSKLKPIVNGANVTAPSIQIYACNLTGNIPECFANLHEKTKQVYVENNKMSGVIPAAVQAHPGFSSWRWDPQQEGYELLLEAPVTYSRQTDSLALVAIYNAAKGAEWKSDRVWDLTKPMDEWYGVKLTEGRVTTLNLASGTISNAWEIPAEIGDLQELTNLRFINDKVTGSFPEEIYTLSKLESLYLTNNTLSWSISPKMANLTALKDLYIDQNANLTGTLPKELGQMKKLVNFNISKTSVSGAIPTEMTGCDALKNFMAFNAQLTSMEDNWDQWPALEIIMIYGNAGLEGPLPESVSRSTTIKTIRFDDCNFTGNIPESYANIPARQGSATTQLWLKGNKLSGVVPAAVQAHENWQPKNAWKYETNILPQQEGYGLTLE